MCNLLSFTVFLFNFERKGAGEAAYRFVEMFLFLSAIRHFEYLFLKIKHENRLDRLPHTPDFKEFDLLKDAIKKNIIKENKKKKIQKSERHAKHGRFKERRIGAIQELLLELSGDLTRVDRAGESRKKRKITMKIIQKNIYI